MAAIMWNENISVGIKTIDTRHKTLVDAINAFYESINAPLPKEIMMDLLQKMKITVCSISILKRIC